MTWLRQYDEAVDLLTGESSPLDLVKVLNNRSLVHLEVGHFRLARADLRRCGQVAAQAELVSAGLGGVAGVGAQAGVDRVADPALEGAEGFLGCLPAPSAPSASAPDVTAGQQVLARPVPGRHRRPLSARPGEFHSEATEMAVLPYRSGLAPPKRCGRPSPGSGGPIPNGAGS